MAVDIQIRFDYDPSQGNLLVDFTATSIRGEVRFDVDWLLPSSTRIIWSASPDLVVADNMMGYVFVRQFVLVPEPATCFLMAVGLLGLISSGWRRRRHAI